MTIFGPGQALQLNSDPFMMFGRVEATMRAANGNVIVGSLVL